MAYRSKKHDVRNKHQYLDEQIESILVNTKTKIIILFLLFHKRTKNNMMLIIIKAATPIPFIIA